MFKITYNLLRHAKSSSSVQGHLRLNNLVSVPVTATARNVENEESEFKSKPTSASINLDTIGHNIRSQNSLIATAFSMLKDDALLLSADPIKTPFTDSRIAKAKTVNELLAVPEGNGISRRLALKIISVLSDWATSGKVDMQQFETDPRFIRICKVLTKGAHLGKSSRTSPSIVSADLSTILGVTAEDEAAKLMSSISLSHMVKVMSFLAVKHHRSITLLRTLAFSISGKAEHLHLKHCADLLYSSAVLNFIDENFLQKVCRDIFLALEDYDSRSAVVGSILNSLGLMRYKDPEILDALSNWILKHQDICRPQDIIALFMTLAVLNHQPANAEELYEVLIPQLNVSDARNASVWLDIVWSLVVLNQASPNHVSSALSEDFVAKLLEDVKYNSGTKLKLLNIDSACDLLIGNYTGSRLPSNSNLKTEVFLRSKDKENMVNLMLDSLRSLINPDMHMKNNKDTKMGFYIDAEIALDNKHNPLPLNHKDCIKVAVLTHEFRDMCLGRIEPTGINALNARLLKAQNYKVLVIPYTEFSCTDKYVNRVKYLESCLKSLPLD